MIEISKWERKIADFFPSWFEARMKSRIRAFRMEGAISSRLRSSASASNQNPEASMLQRDRIQTMWEGRDLAENSPVCKSILDKTELYAFGKILYQPTTGDHVVDRQYSDFIKQRSKKVNLRENMSLRKFVQMLYRSAFRDGDIGVQPVDSEGSILMNPIECDRIGNPSKTVTYSKEYVSGLHLDPNTGRIKFAEVYERSDSGLYINPQMIPGHQFWHIPLFNRFDQWRGVTGFYAVLTRLRDLAETFGYEISAVKWASSIAGLITRKAGLASEDEEDYYASSLPSIASEARQNRLKTIQPAALEYLEEGEDFKQFMNQRPAAAWQGFLQMMIREICIGAKLSYSFGYDASGVQGTALRLDSQQAKRTFQDTQTTAEEQFLDEWVQLQLADGIVKKDIPPHPNWKSGKWRYGAHPTVDVGRESAANLAENRQAVRSGDAITSEEGENIFEVQAQIADEAANILRLSEEKKVPVAMIQTLSKDGNTQNDPIQGIAGQPSPQLQEMQASLQKMERHFDRSNRDSLMFERSLVKDELKGVSEHSPEWAYLVDRLKEIEDELSR